ncbi:hypothetical protein DmGdi_23150 [Gluconobacter sp. Gdi]|nr:hypothetical protein DmGdi_23150 [Gluconobacter sp. Gdi]
MKRCSPGIVERARQNGSVTDSLSFTMRTASEFFEVD